MIRTSARLASKHEQKQHTLSPSVTIKEERPDSPPAPAEINQILISQQHKIQQQQHHQTPSGINSRSYLKPRLVASSGKKRTSHGTNSHKRIGTNRALVTSESSMDEAEEPDVHESMDDDDDILPRKHQRGVSRLSQGRSGSKDELSSARQKLTHVLLNISKGDVDDMGSEDGDHEDEDRMSKKISSKSIRKGQKGADDGVGHPKPQSLVLKLFDRSVDLAKFGIGRDGSVPLYPVCREWIRNQRDPNEIFFHPFDDHNSDLNETKSVVGGIHRLPNPLPINPEEVNPEYGPRVPKAVARPTPKMCEVDECINSQKNNGDCWTLDENGHNLIDMSKLLSDNVERWKSIRKEWRKTAQTNELRYKHSCDVLKAMFEKATSNETLIEPKTEPIET